MIGSAFNFMEGIFFGSKSSCIQPEDLKSSFEYLASLILH